MPLLEDIERNSPDEMVRARALHRESVDAEFAASEPMREIRANVAVRAERDIAAQNAAADAAPDSGGLTGFVDRALKRFEAAYPETAQTIRTAGPANLRAYMMGLAGNKETLDERFFSESELAALRRAARKGMDEFKLPVRPEPPVDPKRNDLSLEDKERLKSWREQYPPEQYRRPYTREHINYRHYDGVQRGNSLAEHPFVMGGLIPYLSGSGAQTATTVGRALIERQPTGEVVLADKYDFDVRGVFERSALGALERLAQAVLPPGAGFPIRVNLGNPADWDDVGNLIPKHTPAVADDAIDPVPPMKGQMKLTPATASKSAVSVFR